MSKEVWATLIETGASLVSDLIKIGAAKPKVIPQVVNKLPEDSPNLSVNDEDISYRFECVMKHLGGASVLLREAYERANDEGVGKGTAEKIVEAMNEHAGAEPDLEHMIGNPQGKEIADRLLSGVRAFRKAAWEVKLPTGGGSKEDIADARLWNALMLKAAHEAAKKYPGTSCVLSGM